MAKAAPLAIQIAGFVDGIRYDRLPSSTVAAVKRLTLDAVGCGLGALGAEPIKMLQTLAPAVLPDAAAATLFGSGRRTTAEGAAIINCALVRYLDFLDVYWSRDVCHPAENIPVAMACVEEAGGGGPALIEAITAGYEVQIRLCDAFSFQERGFHHVSAAGFVVPFIAGKAWKQTAAAMAHGSVLAGMRNMTLGALSKGKLSMAKTIGYAMSAADGLTAARLAGNGFTGPLSAYEWLFEKTAGRSEAVSGFALDHNSYVLEQVSLKQYPVQYALQAPVAAASRLHADIAGRHGQIAAIRARVRHETLARAADPDKFDPQNRETADHSLPSCVAMALLDGAVTEAQFDTGRYRDAEVLRLTQLVEPIADPEFDRRFPAGRPGAVDVVFQDGSMIQAVEEIPFGDRERPMDDASVLEKFMGLAGPAIGDGRAAKVAAFIGMLETQPSLVPLMALCATAAQA